MGNLFESSSNEPMTSNKPVAGVLPQWYWQEDDKWRLYDIETTKLLEEAYAKKEKTLLLTHGDFAKVRTVFPLTTL